MGGIGVGVLVGVGGMGVFVGNGVGAAVEDTSGVTIIGVGVAVPPSGIIGEVFKFKKSFAAK